VPQDISILGFNDLEFCASTFPSLSSVSTPRSEMARLAARNILELVRGSGDRPHERTTDLGFHIAARGSTAQVP
jgi:LacI family gluconate utilization system Gnt-I transcriptional repressor